MGRGVMEPEYRGATARRLMREAMAERDALRVQIAEERETMDGQRDEMQATIQGISDTLAEEKANADGFRIVGANLGDQLDGCLRENAGIPYLMDMIAEKSAELDIAISILEVPVSEEE